MLVQSIDDYHKAALDGNYYLSTRTEGDNVRDSYETCQFVHDRQDLHVVSLILLDPEMLPFFKEHAKSFLNSQEFTEWYETRFTGIFGLGFSAEHIMRNAPFLKRDDAIDYFEDYFSREEKSFISLLHTLYGYEESDPSSVFREALERYIDYLASIQNKINSAEQLQLF